MLLVREGFPEEVPCELSPWAGHLHGVINEPVANIAATMLLLLAVSVHQKVWKGPAEQLWFRAPRQASARWWLGLEQLAAVGHVFLSLHAVLGLLHVVSPHTRAWASS